MCLVMERSTYRMYGSTIYLQGHCGPRTVGRSANSPTIVAVYAWVHYCNIFSSAVIMHRHMLQQHTKHRLQQGCQRSEEGEECLKQMLLRHGS